MQSKNKDKICQNFLHIASSFLLCYFYTDAIATDIVSMISSVRGDYSCHREVTDVKVSCWYNCSLLRNSVSSSLENAQCVIPYSTSIILRCG